MAADCESPGSPLVLRRRETRQPSEFVGEMRLIVNPHARSERGLRRVRLPDVDAVDHGADAFEPALGLVANALKVVVAGEESEPPEDRLLRG